MPTIITYFQSNSYYSKLRKYWNNVKTFNWSVVFITLLCYSPSLCATLYYYEANSYLRPTHVWNNNDSIYTILITLSKIRCDSYIKATPTLKTCDETNMYRMCRAWTGKREFEPVDPALFKNHPSKYTCHVMNKVTYKEETCHLQLKLTGRTTKKTNYASLLQRTHNGQSEVKTKNNKLASDKNCS